MNQTASASDIAILGRLSDVMLTAALDPQARLRAALDELDAYGFGRCVLSIRQRDGAETLLEDDETSRGRDEPIDEDSPETLAVPVRSAVETLGSLLVERSRREGAEVEDDRRLLAVVAALIAKTVEACRDHEKEIRVGRRILEEDEDGERPEFMVGNSHAIRDVFRLIRQVAPFETTVLIRGESGTGKELVAKAIHEASPRANGPFVSVNCGALPEQLVASELFGHVRGAYTGAEAARKGRFELADGGTIFLDEIGEVSPTIQVKLLRVLQEGELDRLGDERTRKVDVRVLAATNANLEDGIEQGSFRQDLYYRLNVFPIYLPPLRERRSDIIVLADHFLEKYSRRNGKAVVRISTPAIELLTSYHWPGNVRELENCVARAVLLAEDGVVRSRHLPPSLQTGKSSGTTKVGSLESMMMSYEREILVEAIKNAGGNQARAARALDTTPRILSYRLRKHGLYEQYVRKLK